MDSSSPGSSVHGISQARIQDGLSFPSLGDLPHPRIKSMSPALAGRFFTTEPPGKALEDIREGFNEKELDGGREIFRPGNRMRIVSMCLGIPRRSCNWSKGR